MVFFIIIWWFLLFNINGTKLFNFIIFLIFLLCNIKISYLLFVYNIHVMFICKTVTFFRKFSFFYLSLINCVCYRSTSSNVHPAIKISSKNSREKKLESRVLKLKKQNKKLQQTVRRLKKKLMQRRRGLRQKKKAT